MGVEKIVDGVYERTVLLDGCQGVISARNQPENHALEIEISPELAAVQSQIATRLQAFFDLDADPQAINATLGADQLLRASVERLPGLRVPGAFDPFEIALRTILGQHISVKAATTISCRVAEAFGKKYMPIRPDTLKPLSVSQTALNELDRLTPSAERIAQSSVDEIAVLGIFAARARCILNFAQVVAAGEINFSGDPVALMTKLVELPGIGPWTAEYIAMRTLSWRDAFLPGDLVVRKSLGGIKPKEAAQRSQTWRPWRSYAVFHLWHMSYEKTP